MAVLEVYWLMVKFQFSYWLVRMSQALRVCSPTPTHNTFLGSVASLSSGRATTSSKCSYLHAGTVNHKIL